MAKVLIVQAGQILPTGGVLRLSRLWFHGLTLPYLAAVLGRDRAVEICDDSVEEPDEGTDADLVAISSMGVGLLRAFALADRFRARGKTVVLGGLTASTHLDEARRHADAVVVGDAEAVADRLLADHDAGRLEPVYVGGGEADLAAAPVPRYDLLAARPVSALYPVETTRGCPVGCEFCIGSHFYDRRHRVKPLELVERDIRAAVAAGARRIIFVDDNVAGDRAHFARLLDLLVDLRVPWTSNVPPDVGLDEDLVRRMARSGCFMVSVGFESTHANSLSRCGNKARYGAEYGAAADRFLRHGIEVLAMMVVGFDEDGVEVFDEAARFLEAHRVGLVLVHVLTPIRGTPLWERLCKEGRPPSADLSQYTATRPVFEPAGMTVEELGTGFWGLYDRLYSVRSILRRTVPGRWRRLFRGTPSLLAANLYLRHLTRRRSVFI